MTLRNTPERWGAVAQTLHWLIALAIIGLAVVGTLMTELPTSPLKVKVYALHKAIGLSVLALVLLRILWRGFDPRPAPVAMPAWQRWAARLTHGGLYLMMLWMPLTGWLYNSAANFPLRWFGLFSVPALTAPDPALKALAGDLHTLGFYLLGLLLALHVGAALKHHFVNRDRTLSAMLPGLPAPEESQP